jgi:hypothetical protein
MFALALSIAECQYMRTGTVWHPRRQAAFGRFLTTSTPALEGEVRS